MEELLKTKTYKLFHAFLLIFNAIKEEKEFFYVGVDLIKAGAESDWAAVIKAAEAGGMPKLAEYVRLNKLKTGAGRRTRKGSKGSKAIKAIKLRLLGLD